MNGLIRVTKRFHFEAAHALYGHDGKCRNIHGHSYVLDVTAIGKPMESADHPKDGMVADFSDLSGIVRQEVIALFDHHTILNANSPHKQLGMELMAHDSRVRLVPYQPSCENMILEIAQKLADKLPEGVRLHALRLYETPTSWAEWFASDNQLHADPES